MEDIILETKTLNQLIDKSCNLQIPIYQRAYEWESYHVKNLLEDTFNVYKKNNSYLMGTIILHNYKSNEISINDIVDGQQRLITLSILLYELDKNEQLLLLDSKLDNLKSYYYIKNTQYEITAFLHNKTDLSNFKYYLKEKLEFSVLSISGENAIDKAYTFFDSANSKGKPLTDFDLLKAHHLMYLPSELEQLARKHNDFWQEFNEKHHELFSNVLRRIRMWGRGHDRDSNTERSNFYEFISTVEPNEVEQNEHLFNRYMQPNAFRSWHRENDKVVLNMKFNHDISENIIPFEIPQTIEGGDSFFLYAKRYHEMYDHLFRETEKYKTSFIDYSYNLSKSIDNEYISQVYKAIILLYFDKFGENNIIEVSTCIELILSDLRFKWGQGKSRPSPIRIETILSYVKNNNLIPIILNSTISSHVVKLLLNQIFINKRETNDSPTLIRYFNRVRSFYKTNNHKVKNNLVKDTLNNLYNINNSRHDYDKL